MSARVLVVGDSPALGDVVAQPDHTLVLVEVSAALAGHLQPGDEWLEGLTGSLLRDRGTWRHTVNRVRCLHGLPALTSDAIELADSDATYEAARMAERDSEHLVHVKQRLLERGATVDRLTECARRDAATIAELRAAINKLEAKILDLGGEP